MRVCACMHTYVCSVHAYRTIAPSTFTLPIDSCPCPNIIHDIEKKLENGINIAVSVCSTAYPLQGACDCADNGCLVSRRFLAYGFGLHLNNNIWRSFRCV